MPTTSRHTTEHETRPADASRFAEAMSALASGVVTVTGWVDGRPWGMTVSAFTSISAAPPTVLVSLRTGTASALAVEETGTFGVSILGRDALAAARHGAAPGSPKFLESFVSESDGANPSVAGALAHLDCEVVDALAVADHTLFVARVRSVRTTAAEEPLVYFRRAYRTLAPCAGRRTRRRKFGCLSS